MNTSEEVKNAGKLNPTPVSSCRAAQAQEQT